MILEARGILNTDKIKRLTERVRDVLEDDAINNNMELMCGASLAHHGLLDSMDDLRLCHVDLSPVPAQQLASLVLLTSDLVIQNVSGFDLVSLLSSLKCKELFIGRQSLGREETQALVRAMESGVDWVWLHKEVTLDIEALTEYSGQGTCRWLRLQHDIVARYKKELEAWARHINNITFDESRSQFLAPTGAQEVALSVCVSVRACVHNFY